MTYFTFDRDLFAALFFAAFGFGVRAAAFFACFAGLFFAFFLVAGLPDARLRRAWAVLIISSRASVALSPADRTVPAPASQE